MNNLASVIDILGKEERHQHCAQHGAYISRQVLRNWSACPKCAKILNDEYDRRQEQQQKLERWQRRIQGSGIPVRFEKKTLDTYNAEIQEQKYALSIARRYVTGFDKVLENGICMIFGGRPGTGKTHLACGIALELMNTRSSRVLFTTLMRAIREVKSTWNRSSKETEKQAIDTLCIPDLLILDEIGIQYGSNAEKIILFDVINGRYERLKPTIMITNLGLNDAREYLGERLFDRFCEGNGKYVPFTWESHRS
jgi:DNA replication protein DnaC